MEDPLDDEMERLLASTELLVPPVGFLERVLSRARTEEVAVPGATAWRTAVLCTAYVAAFAGLSALAFELGLTFGHTGTSSLIAALLGDLSLFADAPGPYLGAIGESLPWLQLLAVGIVLAVVTIVTRLLLDQGMGKGTGSASGPAQSSG